MKYEIEYNVEAQRDLRGISPDVARRIIEKVHRLGEGLTGDVKRLRNHSSDYRLRVGDWRVLFGIEGDRVVVHHVSHRSMLKMKPTFIEENGKPKFVVFSMKEYATIKAALEDAEDLRILDEAKRRGAGKPRIPHKRILEEFGLSDLARDVKKSTTSKRRVSVPHRAKVRNRT